MKHTIHVNGGSAVGFILEKLYKVGAYVVEPGRVDILNHNKYSVVVDWPEWNDKAARDALKELEKEYDMEVKKS